MASESLVNDLFEIVQANSKDALSYDDFEKDLLKSLNLPEDEIDRALAIMLSQAEINPNIIGETKGGTFIVSTSFSASVISTIKYENQFIEGKIENQNKNKLEIEVAGVLLTVDAVDKILNTSDQLTDKEFIDLFNNYAELSTEQQRKLDEKHLEKMKSLEEQVKDSDDDGLKDVASALAKSAKLMRDDAEAVRSGQFDKDAMLSRMIRAPKFKEFLKDKYGIVLTEQTNVDFQLFALYRGFIGNKETELYEYSSAFDRCIKLLSEGAEEELAKFASENEQARMILSKWTSIFKKIRADETQRATLTDKQVGIYKRMESFVEQYGDHELYLNEVATNSRSEINDKFTFMDSIPSDMQDIARFLHNETRKVVSPININKGKTVSEMLQGVASGFASYGMDDATITSGLTAYSESLAFVAEIDRKDTKEREADIEEGERWDENLSSEDYILADYPELLKSKIKEESDKARRIEPRKSEILDVMAGFTFAGTIEDRMSNIEKVKHFSHEVNHSVERINENIKKNIPFDKKPDFEIEALMEKFMKTHAEDLLVGDIPTERAPVQDDIGLSEGITQINAEPIIETPIVGQQEDVEIDESKDDEIKVEEGQEDKKVDFFSPSDFSSAKNLFSSIRTSTYVSVFEEVKSPLSQQEQKKTNEEQGRTDDDEPGQ